MPSKLETRNSNPEATPVSTAEASGSPVQRVSLAVQRGRAQDGLSGASGSEIVDLRPNRVSAKPRRFVRLFKPRFAYLVENGKKLQTVRPWPKRIPQAGDLISLRTWTGRPYWSDQRILREGVVMAIARISIYRGHYWHSIECGGNLMAGLTVTDSGALDAFARADGFNHWADLVDWFRAEHGLPFTGIVIYWK